MTVWTFVATGQRSAQRPTSDHRGDKRPGRQNYRGDSTIVIWRPSSRGICSTLAGRVHLVAHPLQHLHAQILVRHFAAAETQVTLTLSPSSMNDSWRASSPGSRCRRYSGGA